VGKSKLRKATAREGGKKSPDLAVPDWWPAFLLSLVGSQNIAYSAREAGVSESLVHALASQRPEFKAQIEAARDMRIGAVRNKVFQLAVEGVKVPIYGADGTTVVGWEVKFSDKLLLSIARADLPEWREAFAPRVAPTPPPPSNEGQVNIADAARLVEAAVKLGHTLSHQPRPAERPRPRIADGT
jgi:hypothetical protein